MKTKSWSLNSNVGSKTLNHYECSNSFASYGNLQIYLLKERGKFIREGENTRQSVRDIASFHFVHYVCSLEELNMGNTTHIPFIRLSVSLGLSKKLIYDCVRH